MKKLYFFVFMVFFVLPPFTLVNADDIIYWIDETYSTDLTYIIRDDLRDRIYLADTGNKHLVIINSITCEVVYRLSMDSNFYDMAISKDSGTMAVAGGNLYLVDLETFESRQLTTDFNVGSAAFDENGDLMLVSYDSDGYIYHFDPDTETVIRLFGKGPDLSGTIPSNGLLETDSDGGILYFAQRGGSPASLCKFDISGENPVYLAGDGQGFTASNLSDFIVSPVYDEIYIVCGYPYGVQVADSNTLDFVQLLQTGAYPAGVATDPNGYYVYGLPTSQSVLYQFDASQKMLSFQYDLISEIINGASQKRGVAIDRSGERAFIIHGNDHPSYMHSKVQVVELNKPLKLSIPSGVNEGDGVVEGTIMLSMAASGDMTISIESDDSTEAQVPSSVIILSGQSSATFNITILDDFILDGTKSVNITAMVSEYPPSVSSIDIYDNESAILTLNIPEVASEDDGLLAGQGSLSVNMPVQDDVVVNLSSSTVNDVVFPQNVIIPINETSAAFDLFIIDDIEIEGTQENTITALVEGWNQDQRVIVIEDNEVAELTVSTSGTFSEGDNVTSDVGVVTISGILPVDLEVFLSSSDTTEITVPSSVIIPAWQSSATFDIAVIDDAEEDGLQTLTVTANAEGFPEDSVNIAVTDNDNKWIDDTLSTDLTFILRDDERDFIYLADAADSRLVVIDSISLEVILCLPINSGFSDMAISKDNSMLAVAGGTLFFVDLDTFKLRQLSIDLNVSSVAFDHNGDLMLLTSETRTYIHHYDPDTETVIKSFGVGSELSSTIYHAASVKTDTDGNLLYVSDTSHTLFKFDISGETPILLAQNDDRNYLIDFSISPLYSEIYAACYISTYGIEILDSNTFDSLQLLQTGLYQAGVANDPCGYYVYGVGDRSPNNVLFQYDMTQRELIYHYNLATEVYDGWTQRRGIAIDRSGQRAFMIHGFPYYEEAHLKVQVVELNIPLRMILPGIVSEGDGNLENQAEIRVLNAPSDDHLIIYLESDDPTEVQVPGSVTIFAGQTSAFYNITIMDDSILDGTKTVTVRANAAGYPPALGSIDVNDNETATLTLNVPGTVVEGEGILIDQGIISVDRPVEEDVAVHLRADNIMDISFPPRVIIPSGETSVSFDLFINEDTEIEETEEVTITSFVDGWNEDQRTIVIIDNEVAELTLSTTATFSEGDGVLSDMGVVTISGTLPVNLEVSIYSSDTTEITVPSSVIIPAWHTSVTFDITVINDSELDGLQALVLMVSADGFPDSSIDIAVTDNDNIVWIDDTLSANLTYILRDDERDVIYLADAANNQLVLIDSLSLEVVQRISIDCEFRDMAISKDNSTMAVAGETLFLVDLETFATRQLSTDLDVLSVAFDHRGHLMFTTAENWGHVHQYNPDTETVVRSFSPGALNPYGLLKTNDDGDMLYLAERVYSPTSLYKYDISGETPIFLAEDDHGDLGSNLQDFVLAPQRDEIYVACGAPYGVQVVDSNTIDFIRLYVFGTYAAGVATDTGGYYFYGIPFTSSNNSIYQYGASQQRIALHYNLQSLSPYNGQCRDRGIAVDRSGRRAFIIHDSYDVYEVQVVELYLPFDNDNDGLSDQAEVTGCTDPYNIDTDDDRIPDGIEDSNHNGIFDLGETNPCVVDTDADGIQDGIEDINHNGLVDAGETNPRYADTDNDKMPDGWEVENDLDPLFDDADEDADGDGYSNLIEYRRKTDPNDYNSYPSMAMPWLPFLLCD